MIGILIMTLLALIFGLILTNLGSYFKSDTEIVKLLPGYNCGACGYGGCASLANAISKDPKLYTKCRALRGENLLHMQQYLENVYGLDLNK